MGDIFGALAACQSEEPDAVAALKRRCEERSKERVAISFRFSEGPVVVVVMV